MQGPRKRRVRERPPGPRVVRFGPVFNVRAVAVKSSSPNPQRSDVLQLTRYFLTHERARTARDRIARGDLRAAHAGSVHDHAGVFRLRENHSRRRQPLAGRYRARRVRRHAVAPLYFLRLGVGHGGPQARHRRRSHHLRDRQFRRGRRARHGVDHRRAGDSGHGRRVVGGARVHRRPDRRGAPHQGHGDGGRLDRHVVRRGHRGRAHRVPLARHERPVHAGRRVLDSRGGCGDLGRARRAQQARARARPVRRGAAQRRTAAPELRRARAARHANRALSRGAAPARGCGPAGRLALEDLPARHGPRVRPDGARHHRGGEAGQDEGRARFGHRSYPDRPAVARLARAYTCHCVGRAVRVLPWLQYSGSVAALAGFQARAGQPQGRGHGRVQHHAVDRARARRRGGRLSAQARGRERGVLRLLGTRLVLAYNRGQYEGAAQAGLKSNLSEPTTVHSNAIRGGGPRPVKAPDTSGARRRVPRGRSSQRNQTGEYSWHP
ncbi:conserved hypothetical protein [Paraburkholderia unamae]|nr:conserved hypothetical protein [Paraburkholderia unamae]